MPYDPRKRPWYEASVNKKKANLIGPTVFASSGQVGLTFSAPVYVNGDWKVLVIAPRSDCLSDIVSNIGRITILVWFCWAFKC